MSSQRQLRITCPECGQPLYTDELFHTHAWCLNENCKLYIKRMPPYDLCFSRAGESFLSAPSEISVEPVGANK